MCFWALVRYIVWTWCKRREFLLWMRWRKWGAVWYQKPRRILPLGTRSACELQKCQPHSTAHPALHAPPIPCLQKVIIDVFPVHKRIRPPKGVIVRLLTEIKKVPFMYSIWLKIQTTALVLFSFAWEASRYRFEYQRRRDKGHRREGQVLNFPAEGGGQFVVLRKDV